MEDLPAFDKMFLNTWEVKRNPLQILSEYESIRRAPAESVQDYCTRFNSLYNAIPAHIKPSQGLALVKFPDGFEPEMSYQLRETNSTTLEEMHRDAVSVEANLLEKRERMRNERRVIVRDETSTSSADAKIDALRET